MSILNEFTQIISDFNDVGAVSTSGGENATIPFFEVLRGWGRSHDWLGNRGIFHPKERRRDQNAHGTINR